MRSLRVHHQRRDGESVPAGTLAEHSGRVYFQYFPAFLERGFSLSPFHLPFDDQLHEHRDRAFGPLPGVFDDSLPDGWGRLLMDRHFRRLGLELRGLSPLQRLAWLGTRTMGALTYHPPEPEEQGGGLLDLAELARQSRELFSGQAREVLPQLLRAGGSPGGARPKVVIGWLPETDEVLSGADPLPSGFQPWLLKFTAREDPPDTGAVERAYALMAVAAGVDMPPTRLFELPSGDRFFGTQRFDRDGDRRIHVHTFGNLIHSDFRIPSCDYQDLLKATLLLTRRQGEVLRAYRRMAFNVLAHNRDDHVKNFAFLFDDQAGEWRLTPAYDLTFSHGPGGEHAMTVGGEGRAPGPADLLRLAGPAGIAAGEAKGIVAEVQDAVGRWRTFAELAGVGPAQLWEVQRALAALRRVAAK